MTAWLPQLAFFTVDAVPSDTSIKVDCIVCDWFTEFSYKRDGALLGNIVDECTSHYDEKHR